MLEIIINILITLIGLTIVGAAIYYYLPKIEQLLEEKLKVSLSRKSKDKTNQPLANIFYRFSHDSAEAWITWILSQDETSQEKAFAKLIDHLEGPPAEWGSVTEEALNAISRFQYEETFSILVNFLDDAKKLWKKYKVAKPCYERVCKALITMDPLKAKDVLNNEIKEAKYHKLDEANICIVNALASYPIEVDVSNMFIEMLTNSSNKPEIRDHTIKVVQRLAQDKEWEERAVAIYKKSVETFISPEFDILSTDDKKIFNIVFHGAANNITEEVFTMIINSCTSDKAFKPAIEATAEILVDPKKEFSPEQLYKIYKINSPESHKILTALAKRASLNSSENTITHEPNVLVKYPFKTGTTVPENLSEELVLPPILNEAYATIKEALTQRSSINEEKQLVQGGGTLLTGKATLDKLFVARSIASQRKWNFIYGSYPDLVNSNLHSKEFVKLVQKSKSCLIFLDNMGGMLQNSDNSFVRSLQQLAPDPMIFIIGSINDAIEVPSGGGVPPALQKLPKNLFPFIREIGECSSKQKGKILEAYLSKLNSGREPEGMNIKDIIPHTENMSAVEFGAYILEYFKISLLVYNTLISIEEFEKIYQEK